MVDVADAVVIAGLPMLGEDADMPNFGLASVCRGDCSTGGRAVLKAWSP